MKHNVFGFGDNMKYYRLLQLKITLLVIVLFVVIVFSSLKTGAESFGSKQSGRKVSSNEVAQQDCQPRSIMRGLLAGANFTLSQAEECISSRAVSSTPGSAPVAAHSEPSRRNGYYYAFGDSVATGAGLPSQELNASGCDSSREAYPVSVAERTGMELWSFACSGATAGDMLTEQHLSNTSRDIEPQLYTAFATGVTPSLITITAGANDVYWENYLRYCFAQTCGKRADTLGIAGLRSVLQLKLETAFETINILSNNQPPRTLITGYYKPFNKACAQEPYNLSSANITWLNQQVDLLNSTIKRAADKYDYVTFVPVIFDGHELCSEYPWIQGIDSPAPFHPTMQGQYSISESILKAL